MLRGVPTYVGTSEPLMRGKSETRSPSPRAHASDPRAARPRRIGRQVLLRDAQLHADICLDIGEIVREFSTAPMSRSSPRRRRAASMFAIWRIGSPRSRRGPTFPSFC